MHTCTWSYNNQYTHMTGPLKKQCSNWGEKQSHAQTESCEHNLFPERKHFDARSLWEERRCALLTWLAWSLQLWENMQSSPFKHAPCMKNLHNTLHFAYFPNSDHSVLTSNLPSADPIAYYYFSWLRQQQHRWIDTSNILCY